MIFTLNLANAPINLSCEAVSIMHGQEQVDLEIGSVVTSMMFDGSTQIVCNDCAIEGHAGCDLVDFLGTSQSADVMLCSAAGHLTEKEIQRYRRYNYEERYEAFFTDDDLRVIVLPRETFPVTFFFTE